jgi:AraC family transcriptional regulator
MIEHINCAIDHIEKSLAQPLTIRETAQAAGYSRFHFDRLFLAMTGETPGRYIRKRRLTEAARELVTSRKRLLDIALDYQFDSQEAFTRAFKRMFRISPGAYRRRGRLVRTFPRITLKRQTVYRLSGDASHIRPATPMVIFSFRDMASLLNRKFDTVQFFFR